MKEGDTVEIGSAKAKVIETPGHTKGHVSYYFPDDGIVFVGDTLFSVGCGKLLEGDAKTMWSSLTKLAKLPPETKLYCGHEYTDNNCRFALTVEPENEALRARAAEAAALAEKGEPASAHDHRAGACHQSVPPPVEPRHPEAARHGRARACEIFGEIRKRKDKF